MQSIDMKGAVHRIVLQKTDEVKHLDHNKLKFSLVSAAAEGEDHTHRFKFYTEKELFTQWAHALMVAIEKLGAAKQDRHTLPNEERGDDQAERPDL